MESSSSPLQAEKDKQTIIIKIEKTVDDSLIKQDQLRVTILNKAFSGKLVPQDSSDEPAEVLLERIKKEQMRLT